MRASLPCVLLVGALLSGCAQDAPESQATPSSAPAAPSSGASSPAAPGGLDTDTPEVLVTGLEAPWGLDFLPNGDALVTERDTARVLRVPAAGGDPVEVTRIAAAEPSGEGGLLGLVVTPDGSTVCVYVTTAEDNRILRFPLSSPDDVEPVLTGIPKGQIHNGGRLAFNDGLLWAGTGDTGDTSLSQDPDSLGGKVLRMTLDGEPARGTDSIVFSRGHRNVQGIAFGPGGETYAVEFGQNRFDEVNELEPGSNGGWPDVEGPGDGDGRFLAPITTWETSEASPSGAAVVGDALYVAALRGQRLWRVPLADPGRPTAFFEGVYGRLRTAERAPDGSLWVMTSNRDGRGAPSADDDRILRLAPT